MTSTIDKAEAAFTALINSSAQYTPEERADVIEFLARRLGRGVVMMCNGDPKVISEMMEGAVAFAFEEAAEFAPLFDMMMMAAAANRKGRKAP